MKIPLNHGRPAPWRVSSEAERSAHIRKVGISEFPLATKKKSNEKTRRLLLGNKT